MEIRLQRYENCLTLAVHVVIFIHYDYEIIKYKIMRLNEIQHVNL